MCVVRCSKALIYQTHLLLEEYIPLPKRKRDEEKEEEKKEEKEEEEEEKEKKEEEEEKEEKVIGSNDYRCRLWYKNKRIHTFRPIITLTDPRKIMYHDVPESPSLYTGGGIKVKGQV